MYGKADRNTMCSKQTEQKQKMWFRESDRNDDKHPN